MSRLVPALSGVPHGRTVLAGEPLVFHCNHYNYWLQKTVLLDDTLGMDRVIVDAAEAAAFDALSAGAKELGLADPASVRELSLGLFAQLGFGLLDLSAAGPNGGRVEVPVSHYGRCLRQACGVDFAHPQCLFDVGYVVAALAVCHRLPRGTFTGSIVACQSMGAERGVIDLRLREEGTAFTSPGRGHHVEQAPPPPNADANVDEAGILRALSGLDFSGNEEGLLPRFDVMLTRHFANFYNRVSFEFVRAMAGTGLLEAAETLLVEAGYRCAFHTFAGIMCSPEWEAVVLPQCKTQDDWVHGMVAAVNALGWGTWRVHELSPDRIVVRIWDDYEAAGYLPMYGKAERPVSFLAAGAVAGMMNLIRVGNIQDKPVRDDAYYADVFESDRSFEPVQTRSLAMGDAFTEIVASR